MEKNIIPPAPLAEANTTKSNIVYAKSKTNHSYSFSCTFDSKFMDRIVHIIARAYREYSSDYINEYYIQIQENQYCFTIELKSSELKLDYKFDHPSEEDKKEITLKFDQMEASILKL